MVGIFGMSVSLLVLSIGFFVFGDDTSTIAWLAVASLMAYPTDNKQHQVDTNKREICLLFFVQFRANFMADYI